MTGHGNEDITHFNAFRVVFVGYVGWMGKGGSGRAMSSISTKNARADPILVENVLCLQ